DPARKIGPFYHDEADPEKSLFWFAFNTSKRGITLDIESPAGQATFKQLVETADFVIESFPPGYLDRLGLGYSALEQVNPGIIMVSVTPFGQTGPYKDYKAPDIVAWAMGGAMYMWGDPDRPPVRISHHSQAYPDAGAGAAVGAMIALQQRRLTGKGQHVDFSIQEVVVWSTQMLTTWWDMMRVIQWRGGLRPGAAAPRTRGLWPCKDGYVAYRYMGGDNGRRYSLPFVEWMDEEGMANDFLKGIDWDTFNLATTTQDVLDRLAEPTLKFFMAHTKAELLEGAVKHRIRLYPVSTTRDVMESAQLAARKYWVELAHPELGTTITYPGAFAKASGAPLRIGRRAPLIGEHNQEIYQRELAISRENLLTLKPAKGYPAKLSQESQPENRAQKPLAGVRVIDFTWQAATPIAARMLADYGAQVVKIEGRKRHDVQRVVAPFKDGIVGLDRGGNYNSYNNGKLDVTLNLAHPKGVEVAKKLVASADIVMESFAGGVIKKLGLGYEELKKVKPDIIMLSACMQGQTGPYASHPGLGFHLSALAGFDYIAGWPDRYPQDLGIYTDFIVPHFNALAVLAALDYRRRTGKGQYIDLSQHEAIVHLMAPLTLDYVVNRRIADRMGNRSNDAAPHGVYRCRGEDRWCAIAVSSDEEWRGFGQAIGNPAWVKQSKFRTLPARKENEDELERLVEAWTINCSAEAVMTMLQAGGVAAGVVETGQDLMEHDPQLKHRRFFQELDHPEIGKHYSRRLAFMLSKSPCELRRGPLLGEHNEYALKEILGLTDEEIAELVIEGVVE
ncbi:MAG: CoA transferase, partial [Chloroflexi bacterium]|nr:CoA transferase [Chloroflexota bacterium]